MVISAGVTPQKKEFNTFLIALEDIDPVTATARKVELLKHEAILTELKHTQRVISIVQERVLTEIMTPHTVDNLKKKQPYAIK